MVLPVDKLKTNYNPVVMEGPFSTRPSASKVPGGTIFFATDTEQFFLSVRQNGVPPYWANISGGSAVSPPLHFYVSKARGSDSNPGTFDLPFLTLSAARDVMPAIQSQVIIEILDGDPTTSAGDYAWPSDSEGGDAVWELPFPLAPTDASLDNVGYTWIKCPEPAAITQKLTIQNDTDGYTFVTDAGALPRTGTGCFLRIEDGSGEMLRIIDSDNAGTIRTAGGFGPFTAGTECTVVKNQVRILNAFMQFTGPWGIESNLLLSCMDVVGDASVGSLHLQIDRVNWVANTGGGGSFFFLGFESGRVEVAGLGEPVVDLVTVIGDLDGGDPATLIVFREASITAPILCVDAAIAVQDNSTVDTEGQLIVQRGPVNVQVGCRFAHDARDADPSQAPSRVNGIQAGVSFPFVGTNGTDWFAAATFDHCDASSFYGVLVGDGDNECHGMYVNGCRVQDDAGGTQAAGAFIGRVIAGASQNFYQVGTNSDLFGSVAGDDNTNILLGQNPDKPVPTGGVAKKYSDVTGGTAQAINDSQGNVICQTDP